MKLRNLGQRASARGLTLIELVVVLAILVALAGLIIGNFPSLLRKASGSTSANTIQDIARAVSIRQTTLNSVGSGYDSLLNAPAGATVFGRLPTAAGAQIIASAALNANESAAFTSLGLNQICHLDPASPDATWSVATNSNLANIVGARVAEVTDPLLIAKLIPNPANYVSNTVGIKIYLFGVGKVSTLIGANSTLLEAPTRTGTTEGENAQNFYQRYAIAFVVDDSATGTNPRRARLLSALAPTSLGWSVTDDATQMYNQN